MVVRMIPVTIDPELKAVVPDAVLTVLAAPVVVREHDADLWCEIEARVQTLRETMTVAAIPTAPPIAALRKAYRRLGKDPTRYRGSQEALLRRVLKGQDLYRINTVVDLNNLVSLRSLHSVGTFDADTLQPPVVYRVGKPGETYRGIGRDLLNVEGLPVLADQQSAFGSSTSDSERTKVTLRTRNVLMCILSFTGGDDMIRYADEAANLLVRYGGTASGDVEIMGIGSCARSG